MTAVTPTGTSQLFDRLAGQGLAQNRAMLDSGYTPGALQHRQAEVDAVARRLMPFVERSGPAGFVRIVGPAGSGKTSVARVVNTELRQHDVASVALDCRAYDTAYRILAATANSFTTNPLDRVPFTGLPVQKVMTRLEALLSGQVKRVVLWLDHFDDLVSDHANDAVRAFAGLVANGLLSVVLVSRDQHLGNVTDHGLRATLNAPAVRLEAYRPLELLGILDERIVATLPRREHGLGERIVNRLKGDTDAGAAVTILREAVERAERRGAMSVGFADVDAAADDTKRRDIRGLAAKLNTSTAHVLEVLRRSLPTGEAWSSGEAYAAYGLYCQEQGIERVTTRRFADLLRDLDRDGLITAPAKSMGRYGRTREVRMSSETRALLEGWCPGAAADA